MSVEKYFISSNQDYFSENLEILSEEKLTFHENSTNFLFLLQNCRSKSSEKLFGFKIWERSCLLSMLQHWISSKVMFLSNISNTSLNRLFLLCILLKYISCSNILCKFLVQFCNRYIIIQCASLNQRLLRSNGTHFTSPFFQFDLNKK